MEIDGALRRNGQLKIGTGIFIAPVAWNSVRLMLLMVMLMLVGPSLLGVYMGNVPPAPFEMGVVNSLSRLSCSIKGRISGAQEILWGRPPVRAKGRTLYVSWK